MAGDIMDRRQPHAPERGAGADDVHRSGEQDGGAPPLWEWVVALFGLALVLGSIGFMAYQAVAVDDSPPDVMVRTDAIRPLNHGYLVQIRAVNQGGSTAAGVTVEGLLMDERGGVETSAVDIDYVPPHSSRKGGLFFTQDPRKYSLQLRAKGYAEP
jgi:uncharacterized protein (TIGR02588 family)